MVWQASPALTMSLKLSLLPDLTLVPQGVFMVFPSVAHNVVFELSFPTRFNALCDPGTFHTFLEDRVL